jgi:hypothetical protein
MGFTGHTYPVGSNLNGARIGACYQTQQARKLKLLAAALQKEITINPVKKAIPISNLIP